MRVIRILQLQTENQEGGQYKTAANYSDLRLVPDSWLIYTGLGTAIASELRVMLAGSAPEFP
jgi:hypothetical protein